LPDQFVAASFQSGQSWDVDAVRGAITQYGFACLHGYIPRKITNQAFDEATRYFMGVMSKFRYGYHIDEGMAGFDELAHLPSWVWEKRPRNDKVLQFSIEQPLGMWVDPETLMVTDVPSLGQACKLGVQKGWVVAQVSSHGQVRPLADSHSGDLDSGPTVGGGSPVPASSEPRQTSIRLQDFIHAVNAGGIVHGASIRFRRPSECSPLAVSQKWGVQNTKGYQPRLGLGKSTEVERFEDCPGVLNAQLWMRHLLAGIHDCLPTELCWHPEGVSFKAGPGFPNSIIRGAFFFLLPSSFRRPAAT
jgi:hypothetical protein